LAIAASAMVAVSGTPALAAPAPAHVVPGQVVAVSGTPNLWITDSQGVIHFASDPRALAGRTVDWSAQLDLPADQLATLPIGDPWLSMALVQIGGSIYLPQLGAGASAPTLFRIQSPADLAQIGVDADNYGRFVLDTATWEQRYDLPLNRVQFDGDFQLTPLPAAPAPESGSDNSTASDNSSAGDTAVATIDTADTAS
jgi:hypothetical protein